MTSPTLIIGSILIAFGPTFSLLLLLISSKPQLVVLAICAAFAYLLSALASSLPWLIVTSTFGPLGDVGTVLTLSVTGVACQMILRCLFIYGYFDVETAIRKSVSKHEEEVATAANYAAGYTSSTNDGNNADNTNGTTASSATANGSSNDDDDDDDDDDEHPTNNNGTATTTTNTTTVSESETMALQLQLNDLSCSLASGVGYAILHSLFLYGTLLASESGESNSYNDGGSYVGGGGSTGYGGTLYQDSCSTIPSLLNGAIIAMCFSTLDVCWMMLCFYGMRRIIQIKSSQHGGNNNRSFPSRTREGVGLGRSILLRTLTCHGFDDDDTDSTASSGYTALLFVTITHLLASFVLAPNSYTNGCVISLPCLAGVVLWVMAVLGNIIVRKDQFLPMDQKSRIMTMRRRQQQQQMSGGN